MPQTILDVRPRRLPTVAAIVAIALVAGCVGAGPARATEWMFCSDSKSAVEVGLLLGQADTISIAAATITHGDASYTTSEAYGPGKPIRLRETSVRRGILAADFLTAETAQPVGKLVLIPAKRRNATTYKGKLTLSGVGNWTLSCDGE